ncbi:MAG: hypothetical protein ACJAYJ_000650 [Saprospiraceae bacterium]
MCNSSTLKLEITKLITENELLNSSIDDWELGKYKPTPTIIEAAQALYNGHSVEDITTYEAGENSLFNTTNTLSKNDLISWTIMRRNFFF